MPQDMRFDSLLKIDVRHTFQIGVFSHKFLKFPASTRILGRNFEMVLLYTSNLF